MITKSGILAHVNTKQNPEERSVEQIFAPRSCTLRIMAEFHDDNGHPGRERMYDTIKKRFFWIRQYADVMEHVQSCEVCQEYKKGPHMTVMPLTQP